MDNDVRINKSDGNARISIDNKKRLGARRRLKLKLGLLMLFTVFAITAGTTGAWYQSKNTAVNSFNAGSFKTTIAENFTPPENWHPGITTDKVVQITNTGTLDAYTRVELQPTLVFYTKKEGETVNVKDASEEEHYATVNKAAVDTFAELSGYDRITEESFETDEDYASLKDKLTIPESVTLYAKVSKSVTVDESGGTSTQYSYSFVGYYKSLNKYYEISVGESSDNKYNILLYPTQKNEYVYTDENGKEVIDRAITFYYCGNDGKNSEKVSDKWVKSTVTTEDGGEVMYFYYKNKLTSGATTTPLLNAVKLNDTFVYDIYEASFDLNVVNLSSQAYKDAALDIFGASDASFNVNILND
jgi:alternate signal-mediated exported protein